VELPSGISSRLLASFGMLCGLNSNLNTDGTAYFFSLHSPVEDGSYSVVTYFKIRGGFIGGRGCKGGGGGVQKKSNSEIWQNFQGFSFFEVILKLIIQCPYRRKWHF
jgi:hypothetical protein